MKKLIIAAVAATGLGVAFAAEEGEATAKNWRLSVGGFGRGGMEASVLDMGSDRVEAYGTDIDVQYSVWQNDRFNVWAGIGGTFCPRQKVSDSFGNSRSYSEHQDDGYTIYDFHYGEASRGSLDLGYGEFRLLLVPEWKATDALSLGVRLGVAFDWINAKGKGRQDWAWNSSFVIGMDPPDLDGESGGEAMSDSETKFAAQGIVGLQATYLFLENFGLYANVDWRLGDKTDFDFGDDVSATVDMSGWYWGVGAVVSF